MDDLILIAAFDGQFVWKDSETELFEVGNFLGGGAAGTVYECEHVSTRQRYALKILNPLGYKIMSPTLLKRCTVISKGIIVCDHQQPKMSLLLKENIWWLLNPSTRQYLACYYSEKQNCVKELSLSQCIEVWGVSPSCVGDGEDDTGVEVVSSELGKNNVFVPAIPPKFAEFVRKRNRIFREIRNMRKISNHKNVIKLEAVLELIQESKSTLFLVLELANGGELFDRIKIDQGTREETALVFFRQLLKGVKHCHDQGVCHRDLKPENLLLQDDGINGTILKIADFGFSAHFLNDVDASSANIGSRDQQSIVSKGANVLPISYEEPSLKVLKSVVGSPFYVAPEVMQSRGYDGQKADVWSLGVILYAMLAGNLPFGQDLTTCKRFKHFCKWAKDTANKGIDFCTRTDIDFPQWLFPAKFSSSTKGLIVAMLYPDPHWRLSVTEAISHPLCSTVDTTLRQQQQQQQQQSDVLSQPNIKIVFQNSQQQIHHPSTSQHQLQQQPVVLKNNGTNNNNKHTERKNNDTYEDEEMFQMEEDQVSDHSLKHSESAGEMDVDEDEDSSTINKYMKSGLPIIPPTYLDIEKVQDLISTPTTIMNEDEADLEDEKNHRSHIVQSGNRPGSNFPPAFNDMVKRSTRFITAVPAEDVLKTIESILEDVRLHRYETPVGIITKYNINWDEYRLEVWGADVHGIAICALQLYQIPSTMSSSKVLRNCTSTNPTMNVSSLILVEFIRGQLEIFAFKRFYQWVRLKLSEIVKGDYAISLFDQSYSSPMIDTFLRQGFKVEH